MKWSADDDKQSLKSIQLALDTLLPQIKAIEGLASVQRVVCGGCLDFKLVVALPVDKWGAWEATKFAPEEQFFTAVKTIPGVSTIETQNYPLMTL